LISSPLPLESNMHSHMRHKYYASHAYTTTERHCYVCHSRKQHQMVRLSAAKQSSASGAQYHPKHALAPESCPIYRCSDSVQLSPGAPGSLRESILMATGGTFLWLVQTTQREIAYVYHHPSCSEEGPPFSQDSYVDVPQSCNFIRDTTKTINFSVSRSWIAVVEGSVSLTKNLCSQSTIIFGIGKR
jgi:hypothetical protein